MSHFFFKKNKSNLATGDREQRQRGNFSRTVMGKHRKAKVIKTELWEQEKTEFIKQKEKINKTNYIKLSKYIYIERDRYKYICTTYLDRYITINS